MRSGQFSVPMASAPDEARLRDRHYCVQHLNISPVQTICNDKQIKVFGIDTQSDIDAKNDLAFAFHDGHPVTPQHTLIIPRRHAPTYFDLSQSAKWSRDPGEALSKVGYRL